MHLDDDKIKKLLSYKLEMDCIQIKLIQQKENDPIIYSGPGSIFQDSSGKFQFKMYHTLKDISKEFTFGISNTTPGKIIEQDVYYRMEAIDMHGETWRADNIYISPSLSLPANGGTITGKLRELQCDKDQSEKSKCFMLLLLPGEHVIPCTEWKELSSGHRSRCICPLNISNIDINLETHDGHMIITAKTETEIINRNFQERLIEAINIATGKNCQIIYSYISDYENSTFKLKTINPYISNAGMTSPIPHQAPWNHGGFVEFIKKYIESFEISRDIYYGYWHKINHSFRTEIEISALTICTAIEGIIKEYYEEKGLPDEEIISQAKTAKKEIQNLTIGYRIKERLLSNLGQINSPTPKNALYKLRDEGILHKDLISSWTTLRNMSAHADKIDSSPESFQKYIDLVYKCLHLFNLLLFLKIGYEGDFIDLSSRGWPESKSLLEKT